ncbi:MAG: ABC-F family ATP-binding cassette domain-containing protein [Pirellulaceae bacterium]|nr:ABC-F family ATP-binding cassette domain-containing protein [Pirellulaceae bacterium]
MGVLLQIRGAQKSYGEQRLLDDASVSLTDKTKVGFVGRNGAGKSTLLRVLMGEEELEKGEIIRSTQLRIGYLQQHDTFLPEESAIDFLMRDSGQPDWKCGEVAGEFELKGAYLNGPISALSGGWKTRVKLTSLLLKDPNLLVLDEPTNFLDIRTQILLEHFLRHFDRAALIVSHDRSFLQATCDHTLDLSRGKLTMFPGKIEAYLKFAAERREHFERSNAAIVAKQKHLQNFIDKNRARASTATLARSKGRQLERLQTIDIDADLPTAAIRAPIVQPRKGPAVRMIDLSIGYPERTVATGIVLDVEHGQRAAIVGDNGQGKTTLLRTVVGSLAAIHGSVKWGLHCEIGVYAQHVYSALEPKQMVLEYLESKAAPGTTNQQILTVAGSMLFRGDHVRKKVQVLSGGERARLCMAGLLLGTYNVLVLDEPGNHLDVETVESLAQALNDYKGTVLFTSHDRHFMSRVATNIIEVRDGSVRAYEGGYEGYLYYINREIEEGERIRAPANRLTIPASTSVTVAPSPLDAKAVDKEMKSLSKKIKALDLQRTELHDQLVQTNDAGEAERLSRVVQLLEMEIGMAEERWLELNAMPLE